MVNPAQIAFMHAAIIHPKDLFYEACNKMFPLSLYPAWCRQTCADKIYRRILTPDITPTAGVPDRFNTSHKTNKGWRRSQRGIIVVHVHSSDDHSRKKKRLEVQPREKSIQRWSQATLSSRFWWWDGTNHLILRKFGKFDFPWEQIDLRIRRNQLQLISQISSKHRGLSLEKKIKDKRSKSLHEISCQRVCVCLELSSVP